MMPLHFASVSAIAKELRVSESAVRDAARIEGAQLMGALIMMHPSRVNAEFISEIQRIHAMHEAARSRHENKSSR